MPRAAVISGVLGTVLGIVACGPTTAQAPRSGKRSAKKVPAFSEIPFRNNCGQDAEYAIATRTPPSDAKREKIRGGATVLLDLKPKERVYLWREGWDKTRFAGPAPGARVVFEVVSHCRAITMREGHL